MTDDNPELEEWRTIPGHPDYQISSRGRVRSHRRPGPPRLLKPYACKLGYIRIRFDGVHLSVHRLVAAVWHGPCPDGKEVDHINSIRDDNRPENLRYLTRQENMARIARTQVFATECAQGHKLSGENLYVRPNGSRNCRQCSTQSVRNHRINSEIPCSADDCERPAYTRADNPVCEMHYQRARRAMKRGRAA